MDGSVQQTILAHAETPTPLAKALLALGAWGLVLPFAAGMCIAVASTYWLSRICGKRFRPAGWVKYAFAVVTGFGACYWIWVLMYGPGPEAFAVSLFTGIVSPVFWDQIILRVLRNKFPDKYVKVKGKEKAFKRDLPKDAAEEDESTVFFVDTRVGNGNDRTRWTESERAEKTVRRG